MNILKVSTLVLFIVITLSAFFIGNTIPIQDGDTWWQMEYGRYMLQHKTLIPDHSIYTWTPASNNEIYCAWIAEIIFYLLYAWKGLMALFVFKYLLAAFVLALFIYYAYIHGVITHPVAWLAILIGIITHGSSSGSMIKPELFTYVFMSITVFVWWTFRKDPEKCFYLLYAFPIITLIWVNLHGGFVFVALFFASILLGDIINNFANTGYALPQSIRKHLYISFGLIALSLFITPYGYKYPLYLLELFTVKQDVEHLKTVSAYGPTLAVPTYVLYFVIPIIILLYTVASNRRIKKIDWVFIISNVFYAILYTIFGRLMYYWIPVYVFSILYFLKSDTFFLYNALPKTKKRKLTYAIALVSLLIGLDQLRWQALLQFTNQVTWFGWGDSYMNSHDEAEFIATYYKGYKVGNPYNCGGYFLWRMYPDTKIMIDPRYFPFRSWYDEYIKFSSGERNDVEQFLQKYDFDVLHLQYMNLNLYPYFLENPNWKLAYYGTGGMVFVKKELPLPFERVMKNTYIFSYPSLHQSALIMGFALQIGHWSVCKKILDHMKQEFTWFNQKPFVEANENLFKGTIAYYHRDYATALQLYQKALGRTVIPPKIINTLYHFKAVDLWTENKYYEAHDYIKRALDIDQNDPYGIYNLGVINWYMYKKQSQDVYGYIDKKPVEKSWVEPLTEFLKITQGNTRATAPRTIANAILNNTYNQKPPLIMPPEPPIINIPIE
ncbi:MAG: hypothetical protein ACUVRK_12980 [Spirochaetota bacterium]